MARGNKSALDFLVDDLRLEELQEEADLFADDRLPTQKAIAKGFLVFIHRVIKEVEPRFVLDDATRLMAEEIERAVEGRSQRLMLVPAPRSGKSLLMSLGFVYRLLRFPDRPQILISASQRLAVNHSKRILQIFKASGGKLHPKSRSAQEWTPGWSNGKTQAVIGRTTSCLGLGAAVLWLDDVVGSRANSQSQTVMGDVVERYGSDWISRLQRDAAGKGENVVLVNQRLSSTDLAGQLISRAKKGQPWRVVHIPIIHPEDPAQCLRWYPDHWQILQLKGGEAGEPTSSRIDLKTVEERRSAMSPAAFKALFLGDVSDDQTLSPFRDKFLWEVPLADLSTGAVAIALDLAITGKGDAHGYAVGAVGTYGCKGKAVILETGELRGSADELIQPIVDLVKRWRAHTVVVERAGGGHILLKALNQHLADFGVNVDAISHGNRSKWIRLEQELGQLSLGQTLVPQSAPWLPTVRTQFKAIATRQANPRDDQADAAMYLLEHLGRWIRGGFNVTTAEWGRTGLFHEQGLQLATWSRGNRAYGTEGSEYSWPTDRPMPKAIWD